MKAYYDALYRENEHYWGRLPSPLALLLFSHLTMRQDLRVLDLGCGQGPDAIFLAYKGLSVVAIDISPEAITDLKQHAQELAVEAREQDMLDLDALPQRTAVDIVFSRMALQMVPPERRREYISALKARYPDALHAHVVPISGACFGSGFICEDALLKEGYADWSILHYEECWTISRALNRNGEPFLMREARIIARRA